MRISLRIPISKFRLPKKKKNVWYLKVLLILIKQTYFPHFAELFDISKKEINKKPFISKYTLIKRKRPPPSLKYYRKVPSLKAW